MLLPSFIIPGTQVEEGFKLTNSLRFNGSSSRMTTAVMTASNNPLKWTFNCWVKRGKLGVIQNIFGNGATGSTSNALVRLMFLSTDLLQFYTRNSSNVVQSQYATVHPLRDTSGYYNIGIIYDAAQANADDRFRMFINGVELVKGTELTVTNPVDLNATPPSPFDTSKALGAQNTAAVWSSYLDGELSAACFVDGQALVPDGIFGEFNAKGKFVPVDTSVTIPDFGKNGWRMMFDNGADTASLGKDTAPIAAFHASANNMSMTGVIHDAVTNSSECQLVSSPSDNYATGNPLAIAASGGVGAWSFDNLSVIVNSTTKWASSSIALGDDKIYAEFTCQSGVGSTAATLLGIGVLQQVGNTWSMLAGYSSDGQKVVNDVVSAFAGIPFTNADIIGVAVDPANGLVDFFKKTGAASFVHVGQVDASAIPITGTVFLGMEAMGSTAGARNIAVNFGQRTLAQEIPSGYAPLKPSKIATVIKSGTFTGNANANGPLVWMNGTPESLTIDSTVVPITEYDKLATGFKLRSTTHNAAGARSWSATVLSPEEDSAFINRNAQMH
jgi:hypothetical protein